MAIIGQPISETVSLSSFQVKILEIISQPEHCPYGYRLGYAMLGREVWGKKKNCNNTSQGLGMKMSVEIKKLQSMGLLFEIFYHNEFGSPGQWRARISDAGRKALEENNVW